MEKINPSNFPYSSIEEALNYASVKIAAKNKKLIYMIDLPITTNITFDVMILRSNMMSHSVVDLMFTKVFHHSKMIYDVNGKCESINNVQLCENSQLVDISTTSCIPKIIKGSNATCTSTQMKTPNIEEIKEGVLLINNLKANMTGSCDTL